MEPAFIFLFSLAVGLVAAMIYLPFAGTVLIYQYECGVVFTLGKYSDGWYPGLTFIIPTYQRFRDVDVRMKTADIPL
jgi:regulator of protease activity HflC (stomatin/prohibitin superfamily)